MHTKLVCLLNIFLVAASRFLSSHENQELVSHQITAPLSPEAELEQLQASIASLQAKLWVATNKTAAFKAREAQYIKDLRVKWKARAKKIGGYQQRQVELDAGIDALRAQYAETNAECQQHLAVHQKLKQQLSRLALSQQVPAGYAVGAAVLPAGVHPGSPVIVPTTSGPMLVVPGREAQVGAVFQFLFPLHPSQANNAAYVGGSATTPKVNVPMQQKQTDTQVKVQQSQQLRKQPSSSGSINRGAVVQPVPGLPVAAVTDPGDFPQGWPKATWRLNYTYADLLRSPWQKWLAHEVVADEAPKPAPKKPRKTDGPSRYELMKLETQLKWQLKIEESSVTMYENLMAKYEAMMLRANVNSKSMKEHIQASEANYGETGNYLKSEINALEAMCNAAQDLSSPAAKAAVTKMTSAPQSFGILSRQVQFDRQAQFDQKAALEQAFVLGGKHCADEYDWRRTDVEHWEECAFLCRAESACEGFRFTLLATEENCQLTDSCDLGSTRATAFEEPHWQTFFRRDGGSGKASKYGDN